MLLATTDDTRRAADSIDAELAEWQNPNLLHTTGHTIPSLALALALGRNDAGDVDLLGPLVATRLVELGCRRAPQCTAVTGRLSTTTKVTVSALLRCLTRFREPESLRSGTGRLGCALSARRDT